jgi:hypothetical protein
LIECHSAKVVSGLIRLLVDDALGGKGATSFDTLRIIGGVAGCRFQVAV